jgi:hypothetical protein
MEITPVGIVCLVACLLAIARPISLGLPIFAIACPLQTAAAFNLPSVGNVSLLCAYVLLGAFIPAIALRPNYISSVVNYASRSVPIWIFGAFTAYAVMTTLFMPRFFAGSVEVFTFDRPGGGYSEGLVSLGPTSGHLSQSLYAIAHFLMFALLAYFFSIGDGLRRINTFIGATTVTHLAFALLSALPNLPLASPILEFVRTSNYAILLHHELAGITRIIGSYSEPSVLGAASVILFAYNFVRYMQTRGVWYAAASVLLLCSALASLSTTAFATLGLLIVLWSAQSTFSLLRGGLKQEDLTLILINAVLSSAIILVLFFEPARSFALEIYNQLFGAKLASASGVQRGMWNEQGLLNLVETNGFGVGLGSAKTSSLVTALLSNVGVIGFLLFFAFAFVTFLRPAAYQRLARQGQERILSVRLYSAGRAATIAALLSQIISATSVNVNLYFYVFAAVATATLSKGVAVRSLRHNGGAPIGLPHAFRS